VGGSLREVLAEVDAGRPGQAALRRAILALRSVVEEGGWPAVPDGPTLERGSAGERVGALRRRLAASGDLDPRHVSERFFDAELERAVQRFQARHGLLVDGRVGARTRTALNVAASRRLSQLRLNLERMRSLPHWSPGEHLVVNVPEQALHAWSDGRRLFSLRVVVGTARHRTPLFREHLTHLIFHPYWNVPPTLAAREVLPRLRRDPEAAMLQGYEVLDRLGRVLPLEELLLSGASDAGEGAGWSGSRAAAGGVPLGSESLRRGDHRIRQRPGEANALGFVKFMLPNEFNVYFHDTPEPRLFEDPSRAYSHGCIRVEQPVRLAVHALAEDGGWTAERVRAAMRGPTREVVLSRPLTVTIVYLTAWADPVDGSVQHREDVYGLDEALEAADQAPDAVPTGRAGGLGLAASSVARRDRQPHRSAGADAGGARSGVRSRRRER
jgi:murein L,D-transpeptidase YcbB/YkuD